ncbi:4Fe-4S dicluster domain-containing protein [Parabacteroides sp. OttesenSCG-928-G07]|nr:4Fe-4S dicluster domain-containing protein [Parabacteroides sp. OttesenSCG-928-G07]
MDDSKDMGEFNETIANELKQNGIEFIHFVDISGLAAKQNRGFPSAVLFGVKCSPEYLKRVSDNPNYVPEMVARSSFDDDEHYCYEMNMYRISDLLAEFIEKNGYNAYSLSDENQIATSNFDGMFGKTLLPLKTLAAYAGLGWIGKNNLLVNKEYGCCQNWGGVLTDAPLNAILNNPPAVECGNCRACLDVCLPNALKGTVWQSGIEREEMIDVDKCTTCLKCMVHCPWTQRYMKKELNG